VQVDAKSVYKEFLLNETGPLYLNWSAGQVQTARFLKPADVDELVGHLPR
jgi:hypothetical protein